MEKHEVCTTREAAELLGVSLRTVQLWVEAGVLAAWKTPGGHRRVLRESIDTVLRERVSAVKANPPPRAVASDDRLTVLVVEDEPDLLKLYRHNIAFWPIAIDLVTASNGFEALIRIGEKHPDMIFTDLNMPGMDGFLMVKALLKSKTVEPTSVVVVTALGRREIESRGGLPEGVRVFPKPIPFDELEALLTEIAPVPAENLP